MLAEVPLELRSRLGLALFALGRLADEVGVQPSPASTVTALVAGLKDPFLFVVAGEVNAGKSMLLNGLFGEEFCPTSALPSMDKIRYFRHGSTPQEISFSPEIQEIRVPLPFLQDFHVVDTPGVNSVADGHEAETEQFLPRAAAVLFVLPITNPWGQKCWEFLARIHHQLGKRIVLVLSQIDLRSEMEIAAILEHLQVCLQKYLGRDLPVFPVAARQALLARTSGVGKAELLLQSRVQPLEAYLNQILTETDARRERLVNTLRRAEILVSHIQSRLGEKAARLTSLGDALRKIGQAVQAQKVLTWEVCLATQTILAQELTAAPADGWDRRVQAALDQQALLVQDRMAADLAKLWRQTRVTMDAALGGRVAEPASLAPELISLHAAHHAMLEPLRAGTAWAERLASIQQAGRRNRRWAWAAVVASMGLAAGGAGWPWLLGLGTVGLVMSLISLRWLSRKQLTTHQQALGQLAQSSAKEVLQAADAALQSWLQRAFHTFSGHYRPLLEACEQTRTQQEARVQELDAMSQNLATLKAALLKS